MVGKTIKEIIIMLLICLITMLLLAIVLYQYIPSKKVLPEITQYAASEEVADLLEDTIDSSEPGNVISTYEVTSADLNNYQSGSETYAQGKADPFSKGSSTTGNTENGSSSTEGNTTSTSATSSNNKSSQSADSTSSSNSGSTSNSENTTPNNGYFQDTGTK